MQTTKRIDDLEKTVLGNETDEGELEILQKRLDRFLDLLVKKGVISTDEYESLRDE